jgi:hypothetical protein
MNDLRENFEKNTGRRLLSNSKNEEFYYNRDYIKYLEESNKELLEAFRNLLEDAKYLYKFDPNNFQSTEDEYFQGENELIKKYEGYE